MREISVKLFMTINSASLLHQLQGYCLICLPHEHRQKQYEDRHDLTNLELDLNLLQPSLIVFLPYDADCERSMFYQGSSVQDKKRREACKVVQKEGLMKSNQMRSGILQDTKSTNPYEPDYLTSTNLETAFRMAWRTP